MEYNIGSFQGIKGFELFNIIKRQVLLCYLKSKTTKNIGAWFNKEKIADLILENLKIDDDLYCIMSFYYDKNKVNYNKFRVDNSKFDDIIQKAKIVLNEFFKENDIFYTNDKKLEIKVNDFIGVRSVLLFYTLRKLIIYYYDYNLESGTHNKSFTEWFKNVKTNKDFTKSLICDSCITSKDLLLILSFANLDENKIKEMNFNEIISYAVEVVHTFNNQNVFFLNDLEKTQNFSADLEVKDNLSIVDMLAFITQNNKE